MKKIIPIMIAAAMLFAGCIVVLDNDSDAIGESLFVNGVDIIANPGSIPANCSYDSTHRILTLNGATLTSHGEKDSVILDNTNEALTLNIQGTNTITESGSGEYYGIRLTGNLSITGTGSLTVSATNGNTGLLANQITMSGSTLSVSGGSGPDICGLNGIAISGGTVTGSLDSNNGITLSGSASVTGTVYDTTSNISIGDTVSITGPGVIRADAGTVSISGSATITNISLIHSGKGMSISGSPMINTEDIFVNQTFVLDETFSVSGGTINIASGGTIDVDGDIEMSGGSIVFAGPIELGYYGIIAVGGPTYDGVFRMIGGSISITNAVAERALVAASDNDPAGDTVMFYTGATLNNLVFDSNSLKIQNDGAASISFAAPTYTVSFDKNGGTGTMADDTGVSGPYTLPANAFTAPSGKQFKCWSVADVEKNVGDSITVTANTTVKAIWQDTPAPPATTYTVKFDANGGTGTMADVTGVSGEYTLPESTFTAPDGKEFKCWKVGDDEKNAGDKITVSSDITVKAVWKDKSSGGGSNLGLIIGGVVAGVLVVGAVAFFLIKRH